ncbi:MAG TPA: hypothetical protein PLS95_17830, partial [Thermoanaerobaculales bacterium]|nr:hypothetical protein [Thermoanaerobaculales bacterium]
MVTVTPASGPRGEPASASPVEGGAPAAHDGDQDGEEPDESSGEMFGEESLERVVRHVADQPAAAIRE